MPDNSPIPEAGQGLSEIGYALAASSTPAESVFNAISSISVIVNGLIGIGITILLIAFLVFLIRWVVARDGTDNQKIGARGAFRAALALFLIINIWSVIRLLDSISALSPIAMYAIFLAAFILITCWSLFGITDSIVALLGVAVDTILDRVIFLMPKMRGTEDVSENYPGKWSRAFLRIAILAILGALSLTLLWL